MKRAGKQPEKGQRSLDAFIFKKPSNTAPPSAGEHAAAGSDPAPPPAKRQQAEPGPSQSQQADATAPAKRQRLEPGTQTQPDAAARLSLPPLEPAAIPARDVTRHDRFQRKLVTGSAGQAAPGAGRPRTQAAVEEEAAEGGGSQKLSPLEEQVLALKEKHPGVLLAIEVGYKFKFYGEDAEVAAAVLRQGCWPERSFLSTWVPAARLHIHVRRLVEAGHKVGREGI